MEMATKILINRSRSKSKSGSDVIAHHRTSALKPDVAINAVEVLAMPVQKPVQTQGLTSLRRHTWSQNLALGFSPCAFAGYRWLPLAGTSWHFAFCLSWFW